MAGPIERLLHKKIFLPQKKSACLNQGKSCYITVKQTRFRLCILFTFAITPMNILPSARGVYFLANNHVFEQVVAFLRSFRRHNQLLPLCMIPFDGDFDKIAALADTYSFSIFQEQDLLATCDAISEKFHGRVFGMYRKLVTWEGPFESFIYIDVDTVVVDSVDFVFELLDEAPYIASHSNLPHIRRWVWKDNVFDNHILTTPQIEFAANTGFFCSRRGLLPMRHCVAKVNSALELKDCMELACWEQPFINYLVVTSGYSYNSLLSLRNAGVAPDAGSEWWAGMPDGRVDNGKLYVPDGSRVFLVHWAGILAHVKSPDDPLPYKELWNYYRRPDLAPTVCW